jgi:adenylate cyclase
MLKRTADQIWRSWLTGKHPILGKYHHLLGLVPGNTRCKFCNAPFRGPGAPFMRLVGKGPSSKNPHFCHL